MKNKTSVYRRLGIFLLLSFALTWIPCFFYIAKNGKTVDGYFYPILGSFAMMMPAASNFLTRIITKEGFSDCGIKLYIKGKVRYVAAALVCPILCGVLTAMVFAGMFMPNGAFIEMLRKTDYFRLTATGLYTAGASIMGIILGFGEEFGWRAYLTPKLEEIMPFPAAITLSGIIWGLWHAPIIVCGHNYGVDYPGYPYVGIILMCVSCILIGTFLTALVKCTDSVLPAALGHIAFNNSVGAISGTLLTAAVSETYKPENSLIYPLVMTAVSGVLLLIIGTVMIKKSTVKKTALFS